jgi:RimJ/RimL family protein N-acetyltransferase
MAIVNIENVASLKALEKCDYIIYEEAEFKGASCYLLEYK